MAKETVHFTICEFEHEIQGKGEGAANIYFSLTIYCDSGRTRSLATKLHEPFGPAPSMKQFQILKQKDLSIVLPSSCIPM